MKYSYRSLLVFTVFAAFIACKNDAKEPAMEDGQVKTDTVVKKVRKVPTEEEKAQAKSVMAVVMMNPDLKAFASHLVTVGITDILLKEKGPYTVFAPTNAAFEQLDEAKKKRFLNPKNRETLMAILKSHVVQGSFDSATLLENIKSNKGSFVLQTISGESLTVSKSGRNIVVTNTTGAKAMLLDKGDILGSNGMVHTVGSLLMKD